MVSLGFRLEPHGTLGLAIRLQVRSVQIIRVCTNGKRKAESPHPARMWAFYLFEPANCRYCGHKLKTSFGRLCAVMEYTTARMRSVSITFCDRQFFTAILFITHHYEVMQVSIYLQRCDYLFYNYFSTFV